MISSCSSKDSFPAADLAGGLRVRPLMVITLRGQCLVPNIVVRIIIIISVKDGQRGTFLVFREQNKK